jgi:protein-S-isoprenylcysteine O-methyltransferase Ste14
MYTTFFLLFVASSLTSASWIIGFLGLIYGLLILDRVKAEEKMMLQNFGGEYQAYMERSGRFLPKLITR